jgi:hypothetical protein
MTTPSKQTPGQRPGGQKAISYQFAWAWAVVLLSLASASTSWAEVNLPKIFSDGKSVKLVGADKKPGLLGGENPGSESFSVRLKEGVTPGSYQAAGRIVTQAVNTGGRSTGETNEPPVNLSYVDLAVTGTVEP